jgi:hypothetical protein
MCISLSTPSRECQTKVLSTGHFGIVGGWLLDLWKICGSSDGSGKGDAGRNFGKEVDEMGRQFYKLLLFYLLLSFDQKYGNYTETVFD